VPGKLADLILVNGDPTTNISDIRKVEMVMRGRMVFRSAELYGALGIKP
jgi:imidazolonepropionase-like amidohydrolase